VTGGVAGAIVLEGAAVAVRVPAVDLDHHPLVGPGEVDDLGTVGAVDHRPRETRLVHELQHRALECERVGALPRDRPSPRVAVGCRVAGRRACRSSRRAPRRGAPSAPVPRGSPGEVVGPLGRREVEQVRVGLVSGRPVVDAAIARVEGADGVDAQIGTRTGLAPGVRGCVSGRDEAGHELPGATRGRVREERIVAAAMSAARIHARSDNARWPTA
jgi:hypothetical protein